MMLYSELEDFDELEELRFDEERWGETEDEERGEEWVERLRLRVIDRELNV